jgi:hypothetical protein
MSGWIRAIAGIVTLFVALAIIAAVLVMVRPGEPIDPNTAAVRAAAQGALTALYYDDFPPADYQGGPLPSTAAAVIHDRVVTEIERYFSPLLQAHYEPLVLNGVETIGSSDWDATGGFSSMDWHTVYFAGDHATVELIATSWVLRRTGGYGTTPEATYQLVSTMDWGFSLIRINSQWRVETLDGTCLSGCP